MPMTLPASAAAWQLYTYRDGEEGRVAIRSVVKAPNGMVLDAVGITDDFDRDWLRSEN